MGISVILADYTGERIEAALDMSGIIYSFIRRARQSVSFVCLPFIDEYGDTVFNKLQMPTFIEEWEKVKDIATSEEEREFWNQVKALAIKCQGGTHLFMKFIGD